MWIQEYHAHEYPIEKPGYQRRNLHFIKLPSGGAIIVDGQLLTGTTGKSETFEHMTLVPGGHDCYCGRQGCAECYCSLNSLLGDSDNLEEFFEKKISRRYRLYRKMGGLFKTSVHSDQQPAYGSGAYRYIRRTCCSLLYR